MNSEILLSGVLESLKNGHRTYTDSEQMYQYGNFQFHGDKDGADKVMECTSNRQAWQMSKSIKENERWLNSMAEACMKRCLKLKFEQIAEFRDMILLHKDKKFVEATRNSRWGIGLSITSPDIHDESKWRGGNLCGKVIQSLIPTP